MRGCGPRSLRRFGLSGAEPDEYLGALHTPADRDVAVDAGALVFGVVAYGLLPVAPIPNVDFPTITVTASYPGASPQTMASAIATPLEQQFTQIQALDQMTSLSGIPQLLNRRHELFARALASGESASTAYRAAGYQCAPHKARGHGHRLRTREDIAARVQELIDKPQNRIATQQIVEAIRTGRPTIYRPELATLARKLALLGATDQEMADALGIDQGTLDRWKTRHKEFRIAIQLGKILADAEIAESLYNRARGMSLPAVKIFPLEATRGAPSQVVERSRAARISV